MTSRTARRLLSACALASLLTCGAPEPVGCLGSGDPACVPPSPCEALTYTCAERTARVYRVERADQRPAGLDAQAAIGDLVLENSRVRAVIDAIDHPHHLATSGGNLIDLAPAGAGDHLNHVYQVTGILPRDAAKYTSLETRESDGSVSVIARGSLDGDPRITVVTRYELRACDAGVRIRTELFNGSRDPKAWFLADVWYWGDRSMSPFVPLQGYGFVHPPLDLTEIDQSWRVFPWLAAQSHAAPAVSYATVSCGRQNLEGVQDTTVSTAGLPRTILDPGDGMVFERMIFAAAGEGIGGAQTLAAEAHARLNNTAVTVLRGVLRDASMRPVGGDERAASVVAYERAGSSDDPAAGTIWAQTVPSADGRFALTVPSGRNVVVQVQRFGRKALESASIAASGASVDVALPTLPVAPRLTVNVRLGDGDVAAAAEVMLVRVEGTGTPVQNAGAAQGASGERCDPWLGPPHGGSPACNRALAYEGSVALTVPPGSYYVYATGGPAMTLARGRVTLADGANESLTLRLRPIEGIYPAASLSGDFHVHGGRSFDTAFPDRERVMSFVSAGVDVIVATDHDVCTSYQDAVRALGAGSRVTVLTGVEATQLVPFLKPPGEDIPRVIGHFIFWPMPYDPTHFNNGMPWDELVEPGALFDRMRPLVGADGVMQLNHPTAEVKAGRNEGYIEMLGFDPRRPIPLTDDGTAMGTIWRRPGGASGLRNIDYHVQEALNGSDVLHNLTYRETWFAMLARGILRGGTANSDSHSLNVEQLGYPRNIVLGRFERTNLDRAAFNRAVREGRIVGTNGPYIDARVVDTAGATHSPSIVGFALTPGATLEVEVRAAPWIPVSEVRFIVNGRVARAISGAALMSPPDPLGTEGTVRWRGRIPLRDLLADRDGWIVVEAGSALPASRDTDDDGLIDRIDGDGDGVANETHMAPARERDPRFHYDTVTPGAIPWAFTNPFVVDVDGGGWRAPGT